MRLNLTKARYLTKSIIDEINNNPIELIKIGCSKVELSDKALEEIIEHTNNAAELTNINYEIYFKQILNEVIKGYKNNG